MRAEKIRWKDEREVSYEIGTQPARFCQHLPGETGSWPAEFENAGNCAVCGLPRAPEEP